ncbi:multiheme c-type cytochrome [Flavitalea sp. BT771]|uniref:multiheme c-type cytochrome n=1 Tax=Flavitalea sp. BT771 TaxID=3063329 RepID=UPI0026E1F5AF|nr:multiheme c-type cytochrome [Flavitalea sp. BT771]MDO6433534.1 multiheme c-type cytochrome [Flavitalea sp. BT771]MDV6222561.1 multiheme c-type cytochrome [Flavitalea sp. BT771]
MLKRVCRHRSLWVISAIIIGALVCIECTNLQTGRAAMPRSQAQYSEYAGSQACAACHKNIYDTHIRTAHFHTSEQANERNVKGSFEKGKNTFQFSDHEYVAMERRNGRLYQVDYVNGKEDGAQPMDITTGSGKRGQTYLYWEENKLFQLPISYFTSLDQWTNSPGYANKVVFNRPITTRCLECHSTWFQKAPDDQAGNDEFSKTNIIYGVDCEKCHGPGVRHIAFHKDNPAEKQARFIINTNKLTRQQNLDLCRLCHGGKLVKIRPSFTFRAGDSLSGFFVIPPDYPDPNGIDVHGNQYGLLASSKCFRGSQMTCVTCHNPHRNEEGMLAEFSAKCMNCHNTEHQSFCKLKHQEKYNITADCIDCHMPELNSKAITVLLQGASMPAPASMRTHYITVYPEETKKYLAQHKHQ